MHQLSLGTEATDNSDSLSGEAKSSKSKKNKKKDPAEANNRSEKAIAIHQLLCKEYGCPIPYFHNLDPMSELISSLLSHRTKNKDSGQAFKQLREAFPTWEAVREARTEEVQIAIAPCTWPEQKAPRIQQVLEQVAAERGELALDFLADISVGEARAWLENLSGVGPKTSAAVLSFSTLRRRALPVDSHHHRVAIRTGLIAPKVAVGPSHALLEAQLPAGWNAQQVYDNHEVMMLHGQRCCYYRQPECDRCPLLTRCPYGQTRS